MRRLAEDAVDPKADSHLVFFGLEVDVRGPLPHRLAEDAVDELDHRRVFGADFDLADFGEIVLLFAFGHRFADGALQGVEARDQVLDVFIGGDRDAAVERGRDLDVVDGEDVGRVGHRDQQGPLVDEADRKRTVAAGGVDRDQVGGGHVDLVHGEVDVLEPVALGDRPRELVAVDQAPFEKQVLGGATRVAPFFDRLRGAVLGDIAELDEDVGDEAGGTAAGARRRQARRARHRRGDRRGLDRRGESGRRGRVTVLGDGTQVRGVVLCVHGRSALSLPAHGW